MTGRKRHLVLGMGEVGTAVATVLSRAHDVVTRDVEPVDAHGFDVMDVCIPWTESFVDTVFHAALEHRAALVVVHSTVPVGTCDSWGWVHSPIRGRHPHLVDGVSTFVKHFGGVDALRAAESWDAVDVKTSVWHRAAEAEAGKLWELAQFGLQVRVEQAIHRWSRERGLRPEIVYAHFAETYNAGYREMGEEWAVRPILEHVPGPIGGHCVTQNSVHLDHPIADIVREGWS